MFLIVTNNIIQFLVVRIEFLVRILLKALLFFTGVEERIVDGKKLVIVFKSKFLFTCDIGL
jgi:hypothetical protein